MNCKWIGAILILAGCGGFGFSMAAEHIRQEWYLRQFLAALDHMAWELQFRRTPLPELCRMAGQDTGKLLGRFFLELSQALDRQISGEVTQCIRETMEKNPGLPDKTRELICLLGSTLGRFDLEGQLLGLEAVRREAREALGELTENRENRLRSYQTLGLCGGAAIAILLI